jgi:hypothetical protein
MAALYVGSVLVYTHGALLYAGDSTGYYSIYDFINTGFPGSITQTIYGLMSPNILIFLFLAIGLNFYAAYYLSLYFSAMLTSLSIACLIRRMFPGLERGRQLAATGIATFIYYHNLNTYITYYYGVNFVGLNFVYLIAFLAVIYGLPNASGKVLWRDSLLAGVLLGLGAGVFPNNVRLFLAGSALFLVFLTHRLLRGSRNIGVLAQIPAFALAFVVGNAYAMVPIITNFNETLRMACSGAANLGGIAVRPEPWATLAYSLRLLDSWAFNTGFNPSRHLINQNPVILYSTFLWPVAALALPLLVHEHRHRSVVVLTAALMLIAIGWDAGPNPPLGPLYARIVSALPLGQQLFGADFFAPLLAILYSTMISYSVVTLISARRHKTLKLLGVAVLAGTAIVSYPALAGYSVTAYFNPSVHGFWIPQEYAEAREYLSSHGGTTLVLPGDQVYMMTAWNLQDNMYWYNQYFAPARVLTIANFGGGYGSLSERATYLVLVSRITIPDLSDATPINYSYAGPPGVYHAGVSENNGTILSIYQTADSLSQPSDVGFGFRKPLNLSEYKYMMLIIHTPNATYFGHLITNNELWVGVFDNRVGSWYVVNSSVNSYAMLRGDNLIIFLAVGSPDTTFGGPVYNTSDILGLVLQFPVRGNLTISYPVLYVRNETVVNPSWLNLLYSYNIRYILVDDSIISGNMTSYSYLESSLDKLVASGYLRPVWSKGYLALYEAR